MDSMDCLGVFLTSLFETTWIQTCQQRLKNPIDYPIRTPVGSYMVTQPLLVIPNWIKLGTSWNPRVPDLVQRTKESPLAVFR